MAGLSDYQPISALERPQEATEALLSGDISAAWRAMLTPKELTPNERHQLGKKLGLDDGPFAHIFHGLTNPLLITSLILAHQFPVPVGNAVLKLSEKVGSLTSRIPILGRLASKEAFFRGTAVPGILDDISADVLAFKKKYGVRMGQALEEFKAATGRLPGEKEQILASAWLDGLHKRVPGFSKDAIRIGSGSTTATLPGVGALFPNLEEKMGTPLLNLAKGMRGALDEAKVEVFGDIKNRKNILKALARQKKSGFADDATEFVESLLRNPRDIADYYPHRVLQSEEDFNRLIQMMTAGGSSKRFAKAAQSKAMSWASPEVMKRKFGMVPSFDELKKVEEYADGNEVSKLKEIVKSKLLHHARVAGVRETIIEKMRPLGLEDIAKDYSKYLGRDEAEIMAGAFADHMPRSYSLKLMPVLNSYYHTLAGTFGWTIKGGGEKIMGQLDELRTLAKIGNPYAKARADVLENTLIPIAMGRSTFRQSLKAQMWDHSMTELAAKMDNPGFRKVVGDKMADTFKGWLSDSKGGFSLLGMQRKAASYFYLSTLGGNPGSALTNLTQNILTLGPTLGFKTAAEGMAEAMRKSHKYFSLRMGANALSHEGAIAAAYPEFAKAGLAVSPMSEEIVENTLRNAYSMQSTAGKAATLKEKISRAMMSLFTASETANRLTAFESGMLHARRAKLGVDESIQFARQIVQKTQFVSNSTSGPIALLGSGPLAKQFLYFPARMLEFATSTAFTLGSGEKNVMGYNPGTAARMVAGSIIAMELGDMMGIDLRSRLLGGALPTFQPPSEGQLFAPLPVVPPFLQLTGSAAIGASTGDWGELKHSLPLLVPGGVQAFKVAGLIPGGAGISKAFDRTYADYNQPTPDGRIAVYSGKGTFRGFYSPWDLVKFGTGVKGGDLDKEQELLAIVTKNREQITQSKRDYLDARFRNSAREANEVAKSFKQQFGFELPISEADVGAMQLRRHVTRLEQLVRTAPAGPSRDSLIAAIQLSLGQGASSVLGVDPALLGQPRPAAERSRFGSGKVSSSSLPRFEARSDLSPFDQVNPQTIGRQPGTNQLQSIP